MFNQMIQITVTAIANYGGELLLPFMMVIFAVGCFLRAMIFFTVRQEYLFAAEFEKRVFKHLSGGDPSDKGKSHTIRSFHQLVKWVLEKTYHEHFELKARFKRRRFDHVTTITDRLFLIQAGAHRLVKDTLSQTKYLKKVDTHAKDPRFLDISKYVFSSNPVFNKVFGVFPIGTFNEVINLLPGLFVIGGIFGTFLGTMQALPALSQLDLANPEATKVVMDSFLLKMASCMSASIVGIGLSVVMTIINAILAPESMYIDMVNKYTSSMEFLWNDTETNELEVDATEVMDLPPDRRADAPKKRGRKPKSATIPSEATPMPVLHDAGDEEEHRQSDTIPGIPLEVARGATAPPPRASSALESLPATAPMPNAQLHALDELRLQLRKTEEEIAQVELDRATGTLTFEGYADRVTNLTSERLRIEKEISRLTPVTKAA